MDSLPDVVEQEPGLRGFIFCKLGACFYRLSDLIAQPGKNLCASLIIGLTGLLSGITSGTPRLQNADLSIARDKLRSDKLQFVANFHREHARNWGPTCLQFVAMVLKKSIFRFGRRAPSKQSYLKHFPVRAAGALKTVLFKAFSGSGGGRPQNSPI